MNLCPTVYWDQPRYIAVLWRWVERNGLRFETVRISILGMARASSRFRLSLKDQISGESLKVELIDAPGLWGERRYRVRVNGKPATKVEDITLTEVFIRLRRWLVSRAKRGETKKIGNPNP